MARLDVRRRGSTLDGVAGKPSSTNPFQPEARIVADLGVPHIRTRDLDAPVETVVHADPELVAQSPGGTCRSTRTIGDDRARLTATSLCDSGKLADILARG